MRWQIGPKKTRPRTSEPAPAPSDLRILQDFLNTQPVRDQTDRLSRTRDLGDWLAGHGILPAGTELSGDDLARARDLRAGLRAVAAASSGRAVDEATVARLGEVARYAEPRIRFDRGVGRFETLGKTFAEALGSLIGIVLQAQIEGRLRRFKICDRAGCRAVYYDASKAKNGRWCTARCGDRVRAQAYRQSPKYKSRGYRGLR